MEAPGIRVTDCWCRWQHTDAQACVVCCEAAIMTFLPIQITLVLCSDSVFLFHKRVGQRQKPISSAHLLVDCSSLES